MKPSLDTLLEQCSVNIAPLLQILRANPQEEEVFNQLERVLAREDDFETLANIAEYLADEISDVVRQVDLYLKAADVYEEKCGDNAAAYRVYNKVLTVAPGHARALGRAVETLVASQEYSLAVVAVSNNIERVKDPAARADLLAQSAGIRAEHLDDRGGALSELETAAQTDPSCPRIAEVAGTIFGGDEAGYARFLASAGVDLSATSGNGEGTPTVVSPVEPTGAGTAAEELGENTVDDEPTGSDPLETVEPEEEPTVVSEPERAGVRPVLTPVEEPEPTPQAPSAAAPKESNGAGGEPAVSGFEQSTTEVQIQRSAPQTDNLGAKPAPEAAPPPKPAAEPAAPAKPKPPAKAEPPAVPKPVADLKPPARPEAESNAELRELKIHAAREGAASQAHRDLIAYYRNHAEWEAYAAALEEERLAIGNDAGGRERLTEILRQLAEAYEGPLSKPERAVDMLVALLELSFDADIEARIKAFYLELERWADLIQLCAAGAAREKVGPRWRSYLLEAARIAETQLGAPEQAAEYYEQIHAVEHDSPQILEELERIYVHLLRTRGEHERARAFIEAQYGHRGQWPELAQLFEEIGSFAAAADIWENRLSNDDAAFRCLLQVLEKDASDPEALVSILRIGERLGRFAEMTDAIGKHTRTVGDGRKRAHLLLRKARLHALQLNDHETAATDLQDSLAADPASQDLIETAATVFAGDARALAAFLEKLGTSSTVPAVSAEAWQQAARIYREKLHDLDGAIRAIEAAAATEEVGGPLHLRLLDLYAAARRWDPYMTGLRAERAALEAKNDTTSERYQQVLLAMAETFEAPLGDPNQAANIFAELLAIQHDDALAWRLESLYAAAGRWEDLVAWHLKSALREGADPVEHRMSAADVCRQNLNDLERAARIYDEIVKASPSETRAVEALCDIHEQRGRWQELAVLCQTTAEAFAEANPEEQRKWLRRASAVYETNLKLPRQAAEILVRILETDSHDQIAAASLVRIRREQHDPAGLVAALRLLSASTDDALARRDAFMEEADTLQVALNDPVNAATAYRQAIGVERTFLPAWHGLQESLRDAGDNNGLLEAIDQELELIDDTHRKAELQREAASLLEALERADDALERWEKAEHLDGTHVPTLHALLTHYERSSRIDAQKRVLQALTEHEPVPAKKADAHYRLALLMQQAAERAGQKLTAQSPAAEHAREALELDPEHAGAVGFLRTVAEVSGDWETVVRLLVRESELPAPPPTRAQLLHQAATIARGQLNDGNRAAGLDARAVQVDATCLDAARPLAAWYFQAGDFQRAKPLFDRFGVRLAAEDKAESKAQILYHHAVVCRELLQPEAAAEHLRHALEQHPRYVQAFEMLGTLQRDRRDWTAARQTLEALLAIADQTQNDAQRVTTLLALAEVEEAAGNKAKAVERYGALLKLNPRHPTAADAMLRIYMTAGQWRQAVAVLDFMIKHAERKEKPGLHLKRAQLVGQHLDNWKAAADSFLIAAAAMPERLDVGEELVEALGKAGRWKRAAEELQRMAQTPSLEADKRAGYWIQQAAILEKQPDGSDGAIAAYERALEAVPNDRNALGGLATLYEKSGQWRKLVTVLQRLAESIPAARGVSVADLRTRAAWFLRHKLDDVDAAVAELRAALDAAPDYPAALDKLAEIVTAYEKFDEDALAVHHRLLSKNPFRSASLRALSEVYGRQERADRAAWLGNLLRLLERPANAPLQRGSGAVDVLVRPDRPGMPLHEVTKSLTHEQARGPLAEFLELLEEHASTLIPPDFERWGVGPPQGTDGAGMRKAMSVFKGLFQKPEDTAAASQSVSSPAHIQQLVEQLRRLFSINDVFAIDSPNEELVLTLECSTPPTLVLGRGLAHAWQTDTAGTAQMITRALFHLASGRRLIVHLGGPGLVQLILAAIVAVTDPQESAQIAKLSRAPDDLIAAVKKGLPRKLRKDARDRAHQCIPLFGGDPVTAVGDWVETLEWSADRAALLATGDMPATFWTCLSRNHAAVDLDNPLELYQHLRNTPACVELATFACSATLFNLRDRLGLAGGVIPSAAGHSEPTPTVPSPQ